MSSCTASPEQRQAGIEEELGDLLLAAVNACRKLNVRPEEALRGAIRKFCARFRRIEAHVPVLEEASLEEMEAHWQASKAESPAMARAQRPEAHPQPAVTEGSVP